MPTATQEIIRGMNYRKILETIINEGSISRADLSKRLGLTKATISSQVQTLMDDGLIMETGSREIEKGRPPIMLTLNADFGHIISIDIGLSTINLMLANLLGRRCYLKQIPWNGDAISLYGLLAYLINDIISFPKIKNQNKIVGIALGIHGIVNDNDILFTPYYALAQIPLKQVLEDQFSIPVFLENEANLSVLGEKTFAFGGTNLVNISIHSGIGLGLILNGQLYSGAEGFAGEFGHTIIVPNGHPCPCGNRGCIEQYASEKAILKRFNQLSNITGAGIDALIQSYVLKKDAAFLAIDDFIRYMAIGINNIIMLYNPQLIVINSTFTSYIPDIIQQIKSSLAHHTSQKCEIIPSFLQDTASLLGGIHLCSKNFLDVDHFCPPLK
jgi:predicted NBD/HSP70 family sugar kinase